MANSLKLTFPNRSGEELAGRLELPGTPPVAFAIFAHCFTCSKDIAAAGRISRGLSELGFGVLRFDFTGLGNSEGDFANTHFSSNVDDLLAAADYLREHHQAPALLVGHSLGGAAVLTAAARLPEVRAVATIGAPSDIEHIQHLFGDDLETIRSEGEATVELGGRPFRIKRGFVDDLARHDLSSELRKMNKPLLILHSPTDEIVSIDHARKIYENARHPKSFVALDGADHLLSRREDSEYVAGLLSVWARRHIEGAGTAPVEEVPLGNDGSVLVEESGEGLYAQRIRVGKHVLRADEPPSVGGADTGPTPYGLLLAGLGACTTMTLRMYAKRKGWPLEHVAVRLKHAKIHAEDCENCETKVGKIDRIERELAIRGELDAEQRARLLEIAERCPVHRTLHSENEIVTRAVEPESLIG